MVLEGADGCGKSTQTRRLVAALQARGRTTLHVRDPGSTPLSEGVRRLLLDPEGGPVGVRAETFLYMAARAQLAESVVGPALAAGTDVICERWTLSTEVYQGLAGGLGVEHVRTMARLAEAGASPDLVVLLDVAVGQGLERVGSERDRMEQKGDAFHADVVRGYRELASGRDGHLVVPPGTQDEVHTAVLTAIEALDG